MQKTFFQIIIFTRYPEPGKAKTRLIPDLGPMGAARLHQRMTELVVAVARGVGATDYKNDVGIIVCYTGAGQKDFKAWLGPDLCYDLQSPGDLGARMRAAFANTFNQGAKRSLLIGADIPDISRQIFLQALDGLQEHDIVIGPAVDGGYYLIGMKSLQPELFTCIDWGTSRVYSQSLEIITRLGLTSKKLPILNDIYRPEDLLTLHNDPRFEDYL